MSLVHRIKNRLGRTKLRFTGSPVGSLVSINAANALEIAAEYEGVKVETLIESGGVTNLWPKHLPEDRLASLQPFKIECETVLLDITNPEFSFRNHLLHDPNLNVFFADTVTEEEVLGFRRYAANDCQRVAGTVAYLSNTWVDNYYHWMQLTLPLLRLYRQLAPGIKSDYYYIGESRLTRLQEETLAHFGITPQQIIRAPCRADRLLAAICLHRPQHAGMRFRDVWGHEFVRAIYAAESAQLSPRCLYVERGNVRTRKMVNEPELINFLRRLGFVPLKMDGLTLTGQAQLFANAEVIVGTHGAAFTNLLFAREGTKVIEIFPPGIQETSFFAAATHSKLDYHYMIGEQPEREADFNLAVNLEKLARLLEMAEVDGA